MGSWRDGSEADRGASGYCHIFFVVELNLDFLTGTSSVERLASRRILRNHRSEVKVA